MYLCKEVTTSIKQVTIINNNTVVVHFSIDDYFFVDEKALLIFRSNPFPPFDSSFKSRSMIRVIAAEISDGKER